MSKAVGIDLGTTNSCISYYRQAQEGSKGEPRILLLDGKSTIQSCVLLANGEFIVGKEAYNLRYTPAAQYSVKRLMGSTDKVTLVDSVTGQHKQFLPEEISAEILKAMCYKVREEIGEFEDVTITVPAYFTPVQKEATKTAGQLAGFKQIEIVNEPTAAALAYQMRVESQETIMVFDLGGGTFDVSILEISPATESMSHSDGEADVLADFYDFDTSTGEEGQQAIVRVLDTRGDNMLGGDDIDAAILKRAIHNAKVNGDDVGIIDDITMQKKLLLRVEEAKKLNSGVQLALGGGKYLQVTLDDIKFGYNKIMNKCTKIVTPLLEKYKGQIDKIVLVGGSTKSMHVSNYLKSMYDVPVLSDMNPDETVGLGASVVASVKSGDNKSLCFFDIVPETISVETETGRLLPIIGQGEILPAVGHQDVVITEGGVARIYIYLGTGHKSEGTKLGYIELEPEDASDKITLNASVNLDSILVFTAQSKNRVVKKELVKLSNLEKQDKVEISRSERIHNRRIANVSQILSEVELLDICTPEVINNAIKNLAGYREAEDKDEYYSKNPNMFLKLTKQYGKYMEETAAMASSATLNAIQDSNEEAEAFEYNEHLSHAFKN